MPAPDDGWPGELSDEQLLREGVTEQALAAHRDLAGQIGLVPHAKTLVEWLIQKVTRSTVHHAILAVSPTTCISCEPEGALLRQISDFPEAHWSSYDLTAMQKLLISRWGTDHLGIPYGWFSDAAIGIALIFKVHTPAWVERYLNNGSFYECAQFCAAAYQQSGINLFRGRPPATIYPGSFERTWRLRGWLPQKGTQ